MIWNEIHRGPVCAAWFIWHMWTITNFIWGDLLSECPHHRVKSERMGRRGRKSGEISNPKSPLTFKLCHKSFLLKNAVCLKLFHKLYNFHDLFFLPNASRIMTTLHSPHGYKYCSSFYPPAKDPSWRWWAGFNCIYWAEAPKAAQASEGPLGSFGCPGCVRLMSSAFSERR